MWMKNDFMIWYYGMYEKGIEIINESISSRWLIKKTNLNKIGETPSVSPFEYFNLINNENEINNG